MFKGMLGFILGLILLYFSLLLMNGNINNSLNLQFWVFILVISVLVIFCVFARYLFKIELSNRLLSGILMLSLGGWFGFAYSSQKISSLVSATIPAKYDNQMLEVRVYICGLPKRSRFSFSADFCVLDISTEAGVLLRSSGYKVQLSWPLDSDISDHIQLLKVRSRQPRSTLNFVGMPFEASLFYRGIIMQGSVKGQIATQSSRVLEYPDQLRYHYHQLRKQLAEYTDQQLNGTYHHGMLQALILGDRSLLSDQDHKLLMQTGTQHLIAISGLHVGIVMSGLYFLLPKAFSSLLLVGLMGMFYILLVGFGPSAQRAWVMCFLGLLYLSGLIKTDKWRVFFLALFVVLLLDPLAPLNLGFWFSFLCVALLMALAQFISLTKQPWRALFILQLWLVLGLTPIYSFLGQESGVPNILANLLAIPLISLLVLPGALVTFLLSFSFPEAARVGFLGLDGVLEVLMAFLASLNLLRHSWSLEASYLLMMGFVLCFALGVLSLRFRGLSALIIIIMVTAILFPSRLREAKNELLVFDAGQGLAIVMSWGEHTWLYDTGPAHGRYSTVDQSILPYLRVHKLTSQVTGLVVSHGDADHAGDLDGLLDVLEVPIKMSGEPQRLALLPSSSLVDNSFEMCHAGMSWSAGPAFIDVLYPFPESNLERSSSNNRSCVLLFRLFSKTFLIMGDLEAEAELELVRYYRDTLKADVLIAGHHGAAKGTSYALLKHVQPEYVVFSAGHLNRFGHPAESVIRRVETFNRDNVIIQMLNTASYGALRFTVDPVKNQIQVVGARQERAAFWLRNPE